ncbi:DUF2156 domain-containing protein [Anaerolentibacter hominis]|uniref:DUF2156 domain-containing protein n=1 Tax=Anaerolentibacter hominis TaxID=3079009 RepID=UPI0031B83B51
MTYSAPKELTPQSAEEFNKYTVLRPIYMSEGQFLNQFIWAGFYRTKYVTTDKFMFLLIQVHGKTSTLAPYCREEDIAEAFFAIRDYFHDELHEPLKMYLTDMPVIEKLKENEEFIQNFDFREDRACFDYIYDADKLRTLSGKKYHKKKNHLNGFLKEYDGRFEYRTLCCSDLDVIQEFHQTWIDDRKNPERAELIGCEEDGIHRIFQHCSEVDCRIGGVFIDGKLQAYSLGSYNPHLKTAFIHVEKANAEFRGLYAYINQQFLVNEFPDAELVNREDDLGQDGLRQAKLSYQPIRLVEKYVISEIELMEQ